ncbi:PREDICTED: protein YLS9-like [Tarenaya hassleriana]|uniref:protein YLS9-like n=1 Tax=Tarenaya hassleriana TaxID=28532 RepID=UPI00053C947A|nr:PREDICTED: protein YLS9-like [Tarenaya hassleriana]
MQDSSRPVTGYPYPNPYPNPPPPSATVNGYPPPLADAYRYHYPPPQTNPRAALYRRLFIIFMAVLLVLGFALFIFFLVARPRLPDVNINSVSVSRFIVSNSTISGEWDVQFQFRNPNSRMSLYYDDVDSGVFYRRSLLSESHLPPFDQGTKDQTAINATLSTVSNYLEGRLLDSMGRERAAHGVVAFDLQLTSIVGFRYGAIRRRRFVTVVCIGVAVNLRANSTTGTMINPGKECVVY